MIQEQLKEEIRRFNHRWDRYVAERRVYLTQKPIDEARQALLRSAGIVSESEIQAPKRPTLRVIQSSSRLALMTERGLRLLIEKQHRSMSRSGILLQ